MPNQAPSHISYGPSTATPLGPGSLSTRQSSSTPSINRTPVQGASNSTIPTSTIDSLRNRPITVAVDRTVVRIPRIGEGSVSQHLFDQIEAPDQALILALMESVMAGSATRMVRSIVREMCGTSVPVSVLRDRAIRLDRSVHQWNERNLDAQNYPFVFLTSTDVRIRHQGVTNGYSALIGAGIGEEGYREVLGIALEPNLLWPDWARFFSNLKRRGLRGVNLVISSNQSRLVSALQIEFPDALWQHNQDEASKSALALTPDSLQASMKALLKRVLDSSTLEQALEESKELEKLEGLAPEAVQEVKASLANALSIMTLPSSYRVRLRTTRLVDRIVQDVQRRAHVVRVFPTQESVLRLVGTLAMQVDQSWLEGQRYFSMEPYRAWGRSHPSGSRGAAHNN